MTPPRLCELTCPRCRRVSWEIDYDFRGSRGGGAMTPYHERQYTCRHCGASGAGWTLGQQSPPAFLLQPHSLYPMTRDEFARWVNVLKVHFPDHPHLARLGTTFVPMTPDQAAREANEVARGHPVEYLIDQDGARRFSPSEADAVDWVDMMSVGDTLRVVLRAGGELLISSVPDALYDLRCRDAHLRVQAEQTGVPLARVHRALHDYIHGRERQCIKRLRQGDLSLLARLWRAARGPAT